MRKLFLVAAVGVALLLAAAPASAAGFDVWRAKFIGTVITGGATVTHRPGEPIRISVVAEHIKPGSRPVLELVAAPCDKTGPHTATALMNAANGAGVANKVIDLTPAQAATYNSWVRAHKLISVHVAGASQAQHDIGLTHASQGCGTLLRG